MKSATSSKILVFAFALALTTSVSVAQQNQAPGRQAPPAQAQMAPAGAPTSPCANRPLCYDANDYFVTVTEFRTSVDGRGTKIVDAMLHFVNKTNQPISLGYVDQSGGAIDDMGNRYLLNTYGGGVRGMGVVAGNNMDPKFTLPGGGSGDARLEYWWPPYGKLAGVNYEMEFSIREMNRVEGNQWTLGDEALIHYQGLANGMGVAPVSGANSFASSGVGAGNATGTGGGVVSSVGSAVSAYVPGQANNSAQAMPTAYAAAGQPCPTGTAPATSRAANIANTVGQQNQTANNAISNAGSAISSLGSLFKKKNANANTANANANTTPCVATSNPTVVTNPAVATNPAAPNPRSVSPAANTVTTPTATTPGVRTTAVRSTTGTAPVAGQAATTSTATRPTSTQAASRGVTNATMRQAATAATAKPSPAKTTTKTTTTSNTTSTSAH